MSSNHLWHAARFYFLPLKYVFYLVLAIAAFSYAIQLGATIPGTDPIELKKIAKGIPGFLVSMSVMLPVLCMLMFMNFSSSYLTETLPCGRKPFLVISLAICALVGFAMSFTYTRINPSYPIALANGIATSFSMFYFPLLLMRYPWRGLAFIVLVSIIFPAAATLLFHINIFKEIGLFLRAFLLNENILVAATILICEALLVVLLYRHLAYMPFDKLVRIYKLKQQTEEEMILSSSFVRIGSFFTYKSLEERNVKFFALPSIGKKAHWKFYDFRIFMVMISWIFFLPVLLMFRDGANDGDYAFATVLPMMLIPIMILAIIGDSWRRVAQFELMLPFSRQGYFAFRDKAALLLLGETLAVAILIIAICLAVRAPYLLWDGSFAKWVYLGIASGFIIYSLGSFLMLCSIYLRQFNKTVGEYFASILFIGLLLGFNLIKYSKLALIGDMPAQHVAVLSAILLPVVVLVWKLKTIAYDKMDIHIITATAKRQ